MHLLKKDALIIKVHLLTQVDGTLKVLRHGPPT